MNSRPNPLNSPTRIALMHAVILLAGFAATNASAQQNTDGVAYNISTTPAPPPTYHPLPPPPHLSDGGFLPGFWNNERVGGRSALQFERLYGPLFFPALLPVLGSIPPSRPGHLATDYPRALAGEPFFMAYGILAANNRLPVDSAERIARYRSARLALLTELRALLRHEPGASPGSSEHALANLAAIQTSRLLELEAEAEQNRYELTQVEALKATADDIGKWVPDEKNSKLDEALASSRLTLSAAHFRNGFSSDQRHLLEEMALETQLAVEPESGPTERASVFFWPAGARIPEPVGLPPEAAARFEEFRRRKAALKNELRVTLAREESRLFNIDSTGTFARLAAAQAPRFAELDTLADQLRPALAALADVRTNPAAEFPPALARQVVTVVDHKDALQREVHVQLAEFRRELPAERLKLVRQGSGLAIAIVTDSGFSRNRESVLARIETFNAEIATQFEAYATKRAAVRAAIARHQASVPGAKPGITVDQLATDFLSAYNAREYRNQQRDYAAAVFASGLSPAQRRLLLAAVAADSLQTAP
jgi:hypothetical protein